MQESSKFHGRVGLVTPGLVAEGVKTNKEKGMKREGQSTMELQLRLYKEKAIQYPMRLKGKPFCGWRQGLMSRWPNA